MKTYPLAHQSQQHRLKLQSKLKQQRKKRLSEQCQHQNVKKEKHHHKVCREETDVALAVGWAAWWIPILATNNNMRNLTFAEALRDFLQNVSFHCYGKLVETGRCYREKLFWLVFHMGALSALIVSLWHSSKTGDQLLRTTTVHEGLYAIRKVAFPAVSICSINRISNASATRYAEELNKKDPQHRGVTFFYESIKMLRYHYLPSSDANQLSEALAFQQFLDFFDRDDKDLFYNTRNRMAMLTPNCTDILRKCYVDGRKIDCAEEFEETFTSWGLCCTFNRNNKYSKKRMFARHFFGPDAGLTLLLSAPQTDNFYKIFNLDGFIVDIHSPFIYSDPTSGGVKENLALTGTDSFFGVTAQVQRTTREAQFYSAKARNCFFKEEFEMIKGSEYNFHTCITLCRLRSVYVLCGCYPFQSPFLNESSDVIICTLQHIQCLKRYDFKWLNVITQRHQIIGLEREMEDSLYCPDCLPACAGIRYKMKVMDLPLNKYSLNVFPTNDQQNYSDMALVRIYFDSFNDIYYKQVLVRSWFEVFSEVGNICGIIVGLSVIGVCEVLFFFITHVITACKKEMLYHHNVGGEQTLEILP